MPGILSNKWELVAQHLGVEVKDQGVIVVPGEAHVLHLNIWGEDCLSLLITSESMVSGPLLQIPLITSIEINRPGHVLFVSTYRETFRTLLRVSRGGLFKVYGPTWDQVTWRCPKCYMTGLVGFDKGHAGMQWVVPQCAQEHKRVSPNCAHDLLEEHLDWIPAEVS